MCIYIYVRNMYIIYIYAPYYIDSQFPEILLNLTVLPVREIGFQEAPNLRGWKYQPNAFKKKNNQKPSGFFWSFQILPTNENRDTSTVMASSPSWVSPWGTDAKTLTIELETSWINRKRNGFFFGRNKSKRSICYNWLVAGWTWPNSSWKKYAAIKLEIFQVGLTNKQ